MHWLSNPATTCHLTAGKTTKTFKVMLTSALVMMSHKIQNLYELQFWHFQSACLLKLGSLEHHTAITQMNPDTEAYPARLGSQTLSPRRPGVPRSPLKQCKAVLICTSIFRVSYLHNGKGGFTASKCAPYHLSISQMMPPSSLIFLFIHTSRSIPAPTPAAHTAP